jgi:hypothetical protein
VEEGVPRVVKTVGNRPTGSSKEEKGTNPDTEKTQGKGESKHNQKQTYWTIGQNFKLTKNNNTIKGKT